MKVYKRDIILPDGSVLELEHNDQFLDQVREKMKLGPNDKVDDSAIRGFLHGAFSNAIEKHDQGSWVSSEVNLDESF